MVVEVKDTSIVEYLYKDWTETCVKSCLQGLMGKVYALDMAKPDCAVCYLGDYAFYAGNVSEELVMYKPPHKMDSKSIIMVADSSEWEECIVKCYGDKANLKIRYAIKKETVFDADKIRNIKNALMSNYTIKQIDEDIYNYCRENEWCYDFVSNYDTYEEYKNHGLGFVVLYDGIPVAGSSSYSHYNYGIEIEVITREDHRRKGFASCAVAALILECIDRNLYPSWDAANLNSVGLSQKFGYVFDREYNSYKVSW